MAAKDLVDHANTERAEMQRLVAAQIAKADEARATRRAGNAMAELDPGSYRCTTCNAHRDDRRILISAPTGGVRICDRCVLAELRGS